VAKLKVDGGEIWWQVSGTGAPLVILRGLGRSTRHWMGFEKKVAESFQTICIDARGTGRSTARPSWNLTIASMADDVALVLDHLGIPRTSIFGVSLGGMVAMAFGGRHQHRTHRLVVANSSVANRRALRLTPAALRALVQGAASPTRRHELLARVLTTPGKKDLEIQKLAKAWEKIEAQEGTPVMTVLKQLGAAARFTAAELKALNVPTLIMVGRDDQFVPTINSTIIRESIPGCEYVEIDGAGHELTLDKTDEVLAAIKAFVTG
jgi:3-oxoadipate enol-lactonase